MEGREELATRARAGDFGAWTDLYREMYPKLFAYARRRLPSADAADDAVAEAITRAVAGAARYRGEGAGFLAWLYGILRHVVMDAQRSNARSSRTVIDLTVPDGPSGDPEPLEHVVDDEDARRLRDAFTRLSPADQEILELRVVAGLSAEEVGRVVGRKAGAVRMAQVRALARLRALLGEEIEDVG